MVYYSGMVVRRVVDANAIDGFLCVSTLVDRDLTEGSGTRNDLSNESTNGVLNNKDNGAQLFFLINSQMK
jgi:hypothetical protein